MTTLLLLGRICRTCLLESSTMHKLLDIKEDKLQIEEMLNRTIPNFLDLCMEDMDEMPMPVEICADCLDKLTIAYSFQQMCLANNERLRSLINHQEVEDVLAPDVDLNDRDLLKDHGDLLGDDDVCDAESFKSEPEYELSMITSSEMQSALDKLEEATKEELLTTAETLTSMQDQNIDEIKLEIETIEAKASGDSCEFADDFKECDEDDEYWSNNDDNNDESESNLNEDIEVSNKHKSKTTRKYKKRMPSKTASNKTCSECNKTFKKRMFLTRHMSVHSQENQFVCDICEYRFATEKLLKIHISYKHNRGVAISLAGGPYQCPDCPMIFQQTRALAAHRVMHAERDFKCKVCNVNLKTLSAVTRHMNYKHPGVLPYKCETCDKAFPVETHYNDHINMHKGYKKHKCEMCDKSFPNSTALKDHMRSHTGESPFLCSHCGKSFKTSNILRQHLQRHGEKNFQCPECPMRFYVKVNLQKHMCTHSKEKPFICDVCGSSFTRGDSLKAHKFKHSGERPFKCEECNMSFVFKRHLLRHKITHTGEKPHQCTYCERAYAASGDLVKHLRTHLGENTYFCDECPLTFKYQHDLRDHKNQHYKEKTVVTNCEDVDACNEA